MKHAASTLILLQALLVLFLATIAHSAPERRVALVIGNADYPFASPRNPANDARAVAAALKRLGFDVATQQGGPLCLPRVCAVARSTGILP